MFWKTITYGQIYQCRHSITFNPAHDLEKTKTSWSDQWPCREKTHQKILKQKKHNISFSFSVHFQKKPPKSKIKNKNKKKRPVFSEACWSHPPKKKCLEETGGGLK